MSKVGVLDSFRSTDVSRLRFHPSMSTPWSNDHVGTLGVIWEWLRGAGAYPVSVSICSCSTNVCRCGFDTAVSTPWSVDLPATFGVVSGWLHSLGTSTVSHFALLRLADTHAILILPCRRRRLTAPYGWFGHWKSGLDDTGEFPSLVLRV